MTEESDNDIEMETVQEVSYYGHGSDDDDDDDDDDAEPMPATSLEFPGWHMASWQQTSDYI